MQMKLREVNTVVLGRFNPHIILPPWLYGQGIVQVGGPDLPKVNIVIGETMMMTFSFETGKIRWQVNPERLLVSTEGPENTAKLASAVIERLPHTPVSAIGNNFRYVCDAVAWTGKSPTLGRLDFKELGKLGTMASVHWGFKLERRTGLQVQVQMEQSEHFVSISFNYHRQATDSQAVATAVGFFDEDQKDSQQLLSQIIEGTVSL